MQQFFKVLQPAVNYLYQNITIKFINSSICIITLDTNLIFNEIEIQIITNIIRK